MSTHAQVAGIEREVDMLCLAAREMDAGDPAKRVDRAPERFRETQVQLHHFVAVAARLHSLHRHPQ